MEPPSCSGDGVLQTALVGVLGRIGHLGANYFPHPPKPTQRARSIRSDHMAGSAVRNHNPMEDACPLLRKPGTDIIHVDLCLVLSKFDSMAKET